MPQKTKKRKLKLQYRILRGVYRTVVVLSVLIVAAYLAMYFIIRPPEQQAFAHREGEGDDTQQTDFAPKERPDGCYTFLLAARDEESGNSDTIMVVKFDVTKKTVGLVSVPRDTAVYTDRGTPKINSAFPLGIDKLREEVSDLLGIPIDFYVTLDVDAFVEIVDAVGGIDFDVPVEMYYDDPNPRAKLSIHYMPGMQHLNGQQTMEVARFRGNANGTGYKLPDVERTQTQQAILKTIAKKIISWESLTKVNEFVEIFNRNVDTDIPLVNMLYFASQAITVDIDRNVKTGTLPGDGDQTIRGVKYCYVYYADEALAMINELINPYNREMTLDDVHFMPFPE